MAALRKSARGKAVLAVAVVLTTTVATAPHASAYPLSGLVTGEVSVHGTPVPLGVQLTAPSGEPVG